MTKKYQKNEEIMYAKETGKLLGESWIVEPSPDEVHWPDLIVTTKSGKFGLEVTEIFLDGMDKEPEGYTKKIGGSPKKKDEKTSKLKVKELADAYYKLSSDSIRVNLLGDITQHDRILNAMMGVVKRPMFEQGEIEPYDGCKIYIKKNPNSEQFKEYKFWQYVSDSVGWVSDINRELIEWAINDKAQKLPKYTMNILDVRLLLVSDRIYNSGKARLEEDIVVSSSGFSHVYYCSFPEEACQLI